MMSAEKPILIERAEGSNTVPTQKRIMQSHEDDGVLINSEPPVSGCNGGKIRVIASLVG